MCLFWELELCVFNPVTGFLLKVFRSFFPHGFELAASGPAL